MSANIISDKELSALLKLAAASIEMGEVNMELVDDLDTAAEALDKRRGIENE